jgi:phage shock protein PspC (stress-responsive transcriptional regulator)
MTENPNLAEPIQPTPDGSTTTATATPPYPPPTYTPPRPKLYRSRGDRVFSGVCGGIGRHYDIDPVLLRILVVVAAVFTGGVFILAYVLAWILIPEEPAYVAVPMPGSPVPPPAYAAGGTGAYVDPTTGQVYGATAYPYVAPARTQPRSYLGLLTVSLAVLVGALLSLLATLGVPVSGLVIFAAVLLVLGVGLVVGGWRGRARWLIVPAILVLLIVQGTAAVHHLVGGVNGGVGERQWTPTSSTSLALGAGDAVLDLSKLPAGPSSISTSIGAGHLLVRVPPSTTLVLDATVGLGEINLPGKRAVTGSSLTSTDTVPARTPSPSGATVTLTADIGLGQLEVRRASS